MVDFKSSDIIEIQKKGFYKIANKIREKESLISKDLVSSTQNLFVTNSIDGIRIGPQFTNFNPQDEIKKDYASVIEDLALSTSSYDITKARSTKSKEKLELIAMSNKNIEQEIEFEKKPKYNFNYDHINTISGFRAKMSNIELLKNPKIPWQTDSILEDRLKAQEMIEWFAHYEFDSYYITKLMSASLLGIDKKYVPTRQSITATDDLLGKIHLNTVREFEENTKIKVYEHEHLFNKFYIIMLPGKFEYEQFEIWNSSNNWNEEGYSFNYEYEKHEGRGSYAKLQAGGYYASRLPIIEHLRENREQSKISVIRIIDSNYSIPVGVWQVRENVRSALKEKPKEFESKEELKNYLKKEINIYPQLFAKSKIMGQNKITSFFT